MNIENMKIAIAFLNNLPTSEKFSLDTYMSDGSDAYEYKNINECGTSACVIGWTPSMPGMPTPRLESWDDYSEKVYGIGFDSKAWCWCFAPRWECIDNTPKGAAARMQYLLDNPALNDFGYMYDIDELKRLGVYRGDV